MVSIKISRGKFPRPEPGTSALRMLLRLTAVNVEASLLELEQLGMSRVLRNEKVKAISTLASGQDLLAVLKPSYTTFSSCQKGACSNTFFFCLASRLCAGGFYVLTAACFTLRGHDTPIYFLKFLVFMICPLMQERFL